MLALLGCGQVEESVIGPAGLRGRRPDQSAFEQWCGRAEAPGGSRIEASVQELPEGTTFENLFIYDPDGNRIFHASDSDEDRRYEQRTKYTVALSKNGRATTVTTDFDADGSADRIHTTTWNADHTVETVDTDSDADGDIDSTVSRSYDDDENLISEVWDRDADGTPDRVVTCTIVEPREVTCEDDEDGDGEIDSSTLTRVDAQGNVTFFAYDANADGVPDQSESWEFDLTGKLVHAEVDGNADGTPEWQTDITRDSGGLPLTIETDEDGDGVFENVKTYEYNQDHTSVVISTDATGDGKVNSERRCVFDEAGRELSCEGDLDLDGTPDETTHTTYDGDLKTSVVLDEGADGVAEYVRYAALCP